MPNVRLVSEFGPVPAKPGKEGPRLTASNAPCYAELIVDCFGYSSHITACRKFGARLRVRTYPAGAAAAVGTQWPQGCRPEALSRQKKPENHDAGLTELQSAFGRTAEAVLRAKVR
jgi:hypothetical protein